MPNHVTNKITFPAEYAEKVFAACCPKGKFDFETLVPSPADMFRGDVSAEDRKANPVNWYDWCSKNWGTKWNAYNSSCKIEGTYAIIVFDTAWAVPEPVIQAFAEKFLIPFSLKYFDEGHNFWGKELWAVVCDIPVCIANHESLPKEKVKLCIELKGYNPEDEQE